MCKRLHLYKKHISLSFIFPTMLMDKKVKYYLDNNLKLAIKLMFFFVIYNIFRFYTQKCVKGFIYIKIFLLHLYFQHC